MINIFQPSLGDEELKAIGEIFTSNWIGKGNATLDFEKGFAECLKSQAENFTSTTSCTEGIFLSAKLFNFNSHDEIIVPSVSFVAVGSAVIDSGARLVFCDVDSHSLNATAELIAERITPASKAVYITHYGGVPCDMQPILELCGKHDIKVIEDSACAVRSFYHGKACGTLGDMGLWSFDAMKTICTGDGGMIYLQSPELLNIAKEQLYLGLPNRQKSGMDSSSNGAANWWEYQIERPGRRAIMNNIAGAIGCVQLRKIDNFIARRKAIYERYHAELSAIDGIRIAPEIDSDYQSSYYFYWIQLKERDALARYLLENGVYSTFRYWPLHKVEFFAGDTSYDLPNSELAAAQTLNLPLHQALSDDDVTKVIGLIKAYCENH